MGKANLLLLLLFVSSCVHAQQSFKKNVMDSIKAVHIDEAALKYPRIRQFSISHEEIAAGNINSELYGKDFFKGKLRSSITTINLNVPVIERTKNIIVDSFGAMQQHYSLTEVVNYNAQYAAADADRDMTTLSAGINYIHRDSLFGLPVTFNASITGLFNQSFSRQRFTYAGLVSFTFIRNKNSSLMGGLVGIVDPSSPVPAFLFISYYHRFQSARIDLMIDIPSGIAIRKELTTRASLAMTGDMSGSNFFVDINNVALPKQAIYSSLNIKSGLLFEYRLTKKMVLSFGGGLQSPITSKLLENRSKPNNYFIKNSNEMAPYLRAGISLLPFWKLFK